MALKKILLFPLPSIPFTSTKFSKEIFTTINNHFKHLHHEKDLIIICRHIVLRFVSIYKQLQKMH